MIFSPVVCSIAEIGIKKQIKENFISSNSKLLMWIKSFKLNVKNPRIFIDKF